MRLVKVVIVLVALLLAGLVGYAYLGDMGADPQPMRVPVQLDIDAAPESSAETAAPATPETTSTAAPAPVSEGAADALD